MPVKKHAHFEIRNVVSRDALVAGAEAFSCAYRSGEGVLRGAGALTEIIRSLRGGEEGKKKNGEKHAASSLLQRAFRGSEAKVNFRAAVSDRRKITRPIFPRACRETPYISSLLSAVGERVLLAASAVPLQLCGVLGRGGDAPNVTSVCPVSQLSFKKKKKKGKDGGLYIHKYI